MDTTTIISSYKLSASDLATAQKIALTQLGVTGEVKNIVDKSLIAGIKIIAGGRELDLSTSGAIKRLGVALI